MFFNWNKVSKSSLNIGLTLIILILNSVFGGNQKSQAAQIYTYDTDNFNGDTNIYSNPSITEENNKCLNGLVNQLPQTGDIESTQACLNTFGYNPDTNITSPVMIIFEIDGTEIGGTEIGGTKINRTKIGKTSPQLTTTIIYKSQNGTINREKFRAVGARYSQWYAPEGMYTIDYIVPDSSPSFKPAYANFYSPPNQTDKNGYPVRLGFHGRKGNLMAGNGSNGCHRHSVGDMKRIMTIIKKAGRDAGLPKNWYKDTLPVAII